MPNQQDQVNHPKHYTSHVSGVECIDIVRHETFNCGNAIKYIWRRHDKGTTIQDLEKARWYIDDEIKRLKRIEDTDSKSDLVEQLRESISGRNWKFGSDSGGREGDS